MIKFIATDLDGTLLNDKKELPTDFDEVLDGLEKIGVQFAISSGRQHETIVKQFEKYNDRIIIIAENGALAAKNDKILFCDPMDSNDAADAIAAALNEPGLYPLACAVKGAFGNQNNMCHADDIIPYYVKYRTVSDPVAETAHNDILKVAVYDDELSENHCYKIMKDFESRANVFISGDHWLDIMKKGVTKGSAIEQIQKIYGYTPEECMAFGDFMNDADMMRVCTHSYAMENAHPDLKALCRYIAPSNNDGGVMQVIRKVFGI